MKNKLPRKALCLNCGKYTRYFIGIRTTTLNNISYSGMKITTMEANFEKGKRVGICLSFISPIEQITILGIIRNCFIKTTKEDEVVSVLSLEFQQPPYEYNKRVQQFIKNIMEKQK